MSRAIVWIAEDPAEDDPYYLTGRFSGHVDTGWTASEEFFDLPAGEAIAWGRARAAVVYIRLGDGGHYFSAGAENRHPDDYPDWPYGSSVEALRAKGFEALDNTESDPPVPWDVRVTSDLPAAGGHEPFYESIRADPRAERPQIPAPGYATATAAFVVRASTHELASAVADEIFHTATDALLADPRTRLPDGGYVLGGAEVYVSRPGIDVNGPGIVH